MSGIKRGWLYKKGRVIKNWKLRFIVVNDGALAYYDKEEDMVPKGQMSLFGTAVVMVGPPKVDRQYVLEISTPTRTLFVSSDNRDELNEWALVIQHAAVIASGGTAPLPAIRGRTDPSIEAAAASSSVVAVTSNTVANVEVKQNHSVRAAAAASPVAVTAATTTTNTNVQPVNAAPVATAAETKNETVGISEHKHIVPPAAFSEEEKRANLILMDNLFRDNQDQYLAQKNIAKQKRKERDAWDTKNVKLRKTLKGHEGFVNVVSKGDNCIGSAGDDQVVQLWNANTLKPILQFQGHTNKVKCLVVTSRHIISGSDDATVKVWGIDSKECEASFLTSPNGDAGVDAIVATKDGRLAISAAASNLHIWDIQQKKCLAAISASPAKIVSLALAGQYLFTGYDDHTIRMWDMTRLEETCKLEGHHNWIFALLVNPSLDLLYSGSDTLKSWDISGAKKAKVKCVATIEQAHASPSVQCLAITDDDRYLLTASLDGFIKIWDAELKNRSKSLQDLENKTKFIFSLTTVERRVFHADRDNAVKMWE